MKTYLLIFLSLLSYKAVSQEWNVASYSVQLTPNKESQLEKMMTQMLGGDYNDIASDILFELIFNEKESFFLKKSKLYTSPQLIEMALLKIGYHGKVNQKEDKVFLEMDDENYYKAIVEKKYPEWEITTETKMIDNFLCFKANAIKITENSAGRFSFPLEAWFSPEINFNYGPNGYGGLPGLIFELHIKDVVFGLQNIEFGIKPKIEKTGLKNYPIVTEEEYNVKMTQNLPYKVNN